MSTGSICMQRTSSSEGDHWHAKRNSHNPGTPFQGPWVAAGTCLLPPHSEGPRGVTLGDFCSRPIPLLSNSSPNASACFCVTSTAHHTASRTPIWAMSLAMTPLVTQPAPVKLCVLPPPASLLHTGTLSEHHLGTWPHPDLIPKTPAPGQGWKVLGNARREDLFALTT